ncbi:MAG: hypothetical protein GYB65_20975, partial [Chloroflexi bacterium]|nr:hypothetical protein [Chloroflexota bacterium]
GEAAWIALWYGGRELARLDDSPACWELPKTYERDPLPTAWGVWVGPGASVDELLAFGRQLQASGRRPAATVYGNNDAANVLYDDGWLVAWRPWYGDCPNTLLPAEAEATRRWFEAVSQAAYVRYHYLVLNNECLWPDVDYYRRYLDQTLDLAVAYGMGGGLVPHVAGAGAYELNWYPVLYEAHARLAAVGGAYGTNLYPVNEDGPLCEKTSQTQWTTYRYELYRPLLPSDLPLVVTEFARGWGASPPDWADIACFVHKTDGDFAFATAWYAALPLMPWADATLLGQLASLGDVYRNIPQ